VHAAVGLAGRSDVVHDPGEEQSVGRWSDQDGRSSLVNPYGIGREQQRVVSGAVASTAAVVAVGAAGAVVLGGGPAWAEESDDHGGPAAYERFDLPEPPDVEVDPSPSGLDAPPITGRGGAQPSDTVEVPHASGLPEPRAVSTEPPTSPSGRVDAVEPVPMPQLVTVAAPGVGVEPTSVTDRVEPVPVVAEQPEPESSRSVAVLTEEPPASVREPARLVGTPSSAGSPHADDPEVRGRQVGADVPVPRVGDAVPVPEPPAPYPVSPALRVEPREQEGAVIVERPLLVGNGSPDGDEAVPAGSDPVDRDVVDPVRADQVLLAGPGGGPDPGPTARSGRLLDRQGEGLLLASAPSTSDVPVDLYGSSAADGSTPGTEAALPEVPSGEVARSPDPVRRPESAPAPSPQDLDDPGSAPADPDPATPISAPPPQDWSEQYRQLQEAVERNRLPPEQPGDERSTVTLIGTDGRAEISTEDHPGQPGRTTFALPSGRVVEVPAGADDPFAPLLDAAREDAVDRRAVERYLETGAGAHRPDPRDATRTIPPRVFDVYIQPSTRRGDGLELNTFRQPRGGDELLIERDIRGFFSYLQDEGVPVEVRFLDERPPGRGPAPDNPLGTSVEIVAPENPTSMQVRRGDPRVIGTAACPRLDAEGVCDEARITVEGWTTLEEPRVVAHELGHVLGAWEHDERGLMAPSLSGDGSGLIEPGTLEQMRQRFVRNAGGVGTFGGAVIEVFDPDAPRIPR
jgi:hypothetical protein